MKTTELSNWFNELPIWLKYGAQQLLQNGTCNESDILTMTEICLERKVIDDIFLDINQIIKPSVNHTVHIDELSEIKGVNKLNPRKPLVFAPNNLTLIYGANGSGKSSYIRLLKNICNTRVKGEIKGDVYSEVQISPSTNIKYSVDGVQNNKIWTKDSVIPELHFVDIYDADYSDLFLATEAEVTYEPFILRFITQLIKLMDSVSLKIKNEIDSKPSLLPCFPDNLRNTDSYLWYSNLSDKTADENSRCYFSDDDNKQLNNIIARLAEENPKEKADQFLSFINQINSIISEIKELESSYSITTSEQIKNLLIDVEAKKKASEAAAKERESITCLDGLGTESWKTLWEAARKYSQEIVYTQNAYPFLGNEARCILCHQILDNDAKKRMTSFEEFVKGETEKAYSAAQNLLQEKYDSLPVILDIDTWKIKFTAVGMLDESFISLFNKCLIKLQENSTLLLDGKEIENNVDFNEIYSKLDIIKSVYQKHAENFRKDAEQQNRDELIKEENLLKAKKWLSENKNTIVSEIVRLKEIKLLNKHKTEANTSALSIKKSELANELITEEFGKRFEEELKLLGSKVNVSFVKSNVKKGNVTHKIILNDLKKRSSLNEILSEGEYKIVALAAFLADVTGRTGSLPFIFDDPITSLDHEYERKVAERIITLAKERQVIVFTHRLTFLCLLQDCAKTQNVDSLPIAINSRSFGKGDPSSIPLYGQKVTNSLEILKSTELKKLEEIFNNGDKEDYDKMAQSFCSDFRKLIERVIEETLLCNIVLRYRYDVQTKRMRYLSQIEENDCKFLYDLMTKYSTYEHSQSIDKTEDLPEPKEIKDDLLELSTWNSAFTKKTKDK